MVTNMSTMGILPLLIYVVSGVTCYITLRVVSGEIKEKYEYVDNLIISTSPLINTLIALLGVYFFLAIMFDRLIAKMKGV